MRVRAQKQSQPKQEAALHPNRLTQRTFGKQATRELPHATAEGRKALQPGTPPAPNGFAHDFSLIPAHSKEPLKLQTKLTVNMPGDIYEQEADHIAERVTSMPEPRLQRACACGGGECPTCRNEQAAPERLQTKRIEANNSVETAAPPIVHEVLRSSGLPLNASAREFFEPRFRHDFSHVRVHTDARAAESAKAMKALAYTVGHHVVFDSGLYRPDSTQGRHLLAHELTHVHQQRSSQVIQRKMAVKDTSANLSIYPDKRGVSEQVLPATDEPKRLRIAEFQYNSSGKPLAVKLSDEDKKRITDLLEKLRKDDPKFYAAIENEDVVVTRGALPGMVIGLHVPILVSPGETASMKYSLMQWYLFEHSGLPPSQGIPSPTPEAWLKALQGFQSEFDEPEQKRQMAEKKTKVVSETFPVFASVLILDLEKLGSGEHAQSVMATLRHEAGHLLFLRKIQLDEHGNPIPSKELTEPLKSQVKEYSFDENINPTYTDIDLLSEYAAEGLDDPLAGKAGDPEKFEPFDIDKFKEENDPRFGFGGYHDLDGKEQTPTGYGVRMATGLTLVAAKQTARDLKAVVEGPVFLLTVPKPEAEQRRFDVLMLMGTEKKSVRDQFDQLKKDFPVLENYKSKVVAF